MAERPGAALLAAAVLLSLGAAAVWLLSDRPLPPTDFAPSGWRPAPPAVDAQAAEDAAQLAALGDRRDPALEEAVAAWGRQEARVQGQGADDAVREAQTRVEEAALRALAREGRAGYRALGLRERRRFLSAMDAYLAAVRASGEPLVGWDTRHPEAAETVAMRAALGSFLLDAHRTGLVDDHGRPAPDAELVVPVMFMARWALYAAQAVPVDEQLTAYERQLLLAWKAWANPTLSLARRREVLARLAALAPETPVHRILSLHHIRAGDWQQAARETVMAILDEPDDRALVANLHWLLERLEGM